jgi:hypothetical protein
MLKNKTRRPIALLGLTMTTLLLLSACAVGVEQEFEPPAPALPRKKLRLLWTKKPSLRKAAR